MRETAQAINSGTQPSPEVVRTTLACEKRAR
jgi:hypothetical protein